MRNFIITLKRKRPLLKKLLSLLLGAVIGAYAGSAAAQDLPVPVDAGFDRMIGGFFLTAPDYEGSDDYRFAGAPLIYFKFHKNRYVQLVGNQLFVNVLNHAHWELGPVGIYRLGRDDVDDDVVDRMRDLDDSFELGAFLGYLQVFDNNIRHRMKIRLSFTQDVSDGHDGLVGQIAGVYWRPIAKAFDIGVRGHFTLASDDYMSSYFDVTPADAASSGLPLFDADGGTKDTGVAVMGLFHLSRNWHIGAGVFYRRLVGDAEDSPVVDIRGSANQIFAGLGVLYTW